MYRALDHLVRADLTPPLILPGRERLTCKPVRPKGDVKGRGIRIIVTDIGERACPAAHQIGLYLSDCGVLVNGVFRDGDLPGRHVHTLESRHRGGRLLPHRG